MTVSDMAEVAGYVVALMGAGLGLAVGVIKGLSRLDSRRSGYHPYEEARSNAKLDELIHLQRRLLDAVIETKTMVQVMTVNRRSDDG